MKAETVTVAKGQRGAAGAVSAVTARIKIPAEQRAANGGTQERAGGQMARNKTHFKSSFQPALSDFSEIQLTAMWKPICLSMGYEPSSKTDGGGS